MICNDARHRWHRRLDQGGLDAELDRHLAACGECRAYAARMQRLVGLMDELREDTEPLSAPSIETARTITIATHRERRVLGARNLMRIAAAVLVTVSVGLWYGTERSATPVSVNPHAPQPFRESGPSEGVSGITLRAESGKRFIAVAAPSVEPNVQTFWLYPSVAVTGTQN